MKKEKISIIIPAYNEQDCIISTLESIIVFFLKREQEYEILVIDDGSKDQTVPLLNEFRANKKNIQLLLNEKNKGKGFSVKKGILAATGDLCLFMDADSSTRIKEYEKLEKFLVDFEIVIGSRSIEEAKVERSWYRLAIAKLSNQMIRFILGLSFRDTQCGFKLFRGEVVKNLFEEQQLLRWGFDFELLYLAQKKGLKIKEVGVTWRSVGNSTVQWRDLFLTFWELIGLRYKK